MKGKNLFLLIVVLTFSSFQFKFNDDPLRKLVFSELKLFYMDGKCGEWGGDKETLTISQKNSEDAIYADYVKETVSCAESNSLKVLKKITKNKIKLTDNDKGQLTKLIKDLAEEALSSELVPSPGGYFKQASLRDSSLLIYVSTHRKWTTFEKLRDNLLKK